MSKKRTIGSILLILVFSFAMSLSFYQVAYATCSSGACDCRKWCSERQLFLCWQKYFPPVPPETEGHCEAVCIPDGPDSCFDI